MRILLVEDDEVDVMAVKRAFRELKIANPLVEARDGVADAGRALLGEEHARTVRHDDVAGAAAASAAGVVVCVPMNLATFACTMPLVYW